MIHHTISIVWWSYHWFRFLFISLNYSDYQSLIEKKLIENELEMKDLITSKLEESSRPIKYS